MQADYEVPARLFVLSMYPAYSLLLTFGILLLLPRFLFQALVHGKYIHGFRERLGAISAINKTGQPIIWLHCVSVGETQAARALVNQMRLAFPDSSLVISTTTLTGQKLAREVFKQHASQVFYFPFDWMWTVRRALSRVDPTLVLLMETELWPNFLRECTHRRIRVAIVNGRISRNSFQRYRFIRVFLKRVLSALDLALMQSESDAERIRELGMPANKIAVTGNLKFDSSDLLANNAIRDELESRFDFSGEKSLIVAASTHAPEEQVLIESLKILQEHSHVRMLLAPRHPERFQEVAALLDKSGFRWSRRTSSACEADKISDVVLLDTIGELPATYSFADIVFVGGSIVDKGGHNLLEPASLGACIVTGAHTHNFRAIVELLRKEEAVIQLPPIDDNLASELSNVFLQLLQHPKTREKMGQQARRTVDANRGATSKTIALVRSLLQPEDDHRVETETSGASATA